MDTVGKRLAWARQQRGMTQLQLAKEAGVSRMSVVRLEQDGNKTAPHPGTLKWLANALDVDEEWLRDGTVGIGRDLRLPHIKEEPAPEG